MANTPKSRRRVLIVDDNLWNTYDRFNQNDYSEHLRPLCEKTGYALAMVAESVDQLKRAMPNARGFIQLLQAEPAIHNVQSRPDVILVVYSYHPALRNAVNSLLVSVKGFLDIHAVLMTKRLKSDAKINGFNKIEKRAGRRLTNWIEKSVSENLTGRTRLINTIEGHVDEWIQEAVEWRDQVVHDGYLKAMTDIHVDLDIEQTPINLSESDVQLPRMPNGSLPTKYADRLSANLSRYIREIEALLPPPSP